MGILSNGYKHYKEIFWFEFLQHDHWLEKDWIALSKNNRASRILLFCCHIINCHFSTIEFFPHHSNLEVSSLRFIFKNKFQTFSQSLFSILKVIFIDILFLFQKQKRFFSNENNLGFHMRYHFFSALWCMVSSESWKRLHPN